MSAQVNLEEKQILKCLPLVNFILSLLIVFHHSFTTNVDFTGSYSIGAYGWQVAAERFMYNLSECAVPIFYFLSAYLFYRTFDGSWEKYKTKIARRFFSLFIPYILFCSLGYIKHLAVSHVWGGILDYLHSLWICDTMPLWFIRELMALSLIAPIIYKLKQNLPLTIAVCILCITLVTLGYVPYRSFLYWLPIYIMGAMMTPDKWSTYSRTIKAHLPLFGIAGIAYIICVWFLPNGILQHNYRGNFEFVIFRIFTVVFFVASACMLTKVDIEPKKWMNYSFFVFCMHFPVISVMALLYGKTVKTIVGAELLEYTLTVISTYTICVIMAMALQRFAPKLWTILNGKR